ncbi:MAG TPA: DUF4157 domain-containing protein [Kofleriaceae bacterium]|nr:DUF4157 domain-containing protein [Kofleriaceae bacterium]
MPGRGSEATGAPAPGKTTLVEQTAAIQRKATGAAPAAGVDAAVASASAASGAPVDGAMRGRVEAATGAQLGDVSVHTGPESNAAATALGARAYATGNQIHFASGQYAPASADGQHLLAHELTHTVQQRGGGGLQAKGRVSEPGDAGEREADRVADAVMAGGHAGAIRETSASIARQTPPATPATPAAPAPSGRHEITDFGEYWVVPDATNRSVADAQGEQITETAFAAVKAAWDKVKDGSGNIKISENDSAGTAHAGFKASVTTKIGLLMAKPKGRELVTSLLSGGFDVTIRPSAAKVYGGAQAIRGGAGTLEQAGGSAGAGGTTIIEIDPACTDNDIKVYDQNGAEISDPVYIFLGHEMIHARHNQLGRNRRNLAATDPAKYSNREEEETIATGGGITENQLRAEHGLDARVGHGGVDKRP